MSTPNLRPVPPREEDATPATRHDPVTEGVSCVSSLFHDGQMRTCEKGSGHNFRSGERQHHGGGRRWETRGNNAPVTVVSVCPTTCACRADGRAWG